MAVLDDTSKYVTVKDLMRLLKKLEPTYLLRANMVGNLFILNEKQEGIGFIDFFPEHGALEMYAAYEED